MTVVTLHHEPSTALALVPAGQPDELTEALAATHAAQTELAAATHAVIVASEYVARAALLVARAHALRAHELLPDPRTGHPYRTWAAYCAAELPGLRLLRIELDTRVQLVVQLVGAGLSRRAVGHAIGAADQTVRADLERAERAAAAEAPAPAAERAAASTPTQVAAPTRASHRAILLGELDDAGQAGLTSAESERRHPRWTPAPWSLLSMLHRDGLVERLAATEESGTRAGRAVYVRREHLAGRATEPPGQGRRRRRQAAQGA